MNSTNNTIWSSSISRAAINPVAQLLDTGNLAVRAENDNDPENFLWQSFDYPGDSFFTGNEIWYKLVDRPQSIPDILEKPQ
ncbi:hypothetical protein OIU84_024295 [Salix udensis]|uniref:Bulb-type lectin domain-containing protein n=1 Tax=Salix udensis TaxID=889485 RepID=A0AAD6PBU7_9ROSI|nr:hypothetical protein OIU84_024295 [Salix udensis]